MNPTGQYELWPGEFVLFICSGAAAEREGQRFLDIFKNTWAEVPRTDRRIILGHFGPSPRVVLQPNLTLHGPIAEAPDMGVMVHADPLQIFELPGGDAGIRLVIAEELAHAYLHATKDPTHVAPRPIDPHQELAWDNAREAAARRVMASWLAFDMNDHRNLIAKVINRRNGGQPS